MSMNITFLSKDEYIVDDVVVKDLHHRPFCIFDLEGTGIHFETEYITQIGAVMVREGKIDHSRTFQSLVKSPKPIPPAVERLTGITNEHLLNAPAFPEVYRRFIRFAGDAVLVTQAGYEYDVPMLKRHCARHRLPMCGNPIIDTKALFAHIHPELNDVFSTDYLLNYYHIDGSDVRRHDAMGDGILIARIFLCILQEYEERCIADFALTGGLKVKRFVIPGMYLYEDGHAG